MTYFYTHHHYKLRTILNRLLNFRIILLLSYRISE